LILGTKVVPNTAARLNYGLGTNLEVIDGKNGYTFTGLAASLIIPISKIAHVYLPPGTYSFNVGARTAHVQANCWSSTVTYELIQFENSQLTDLGNYPLITTLPK
jgi:hypothetical protein